MKRGLIVGGTSGLGLELAARLAHEGEVIVTGSGKHRPEEFKYYEIDLGNGPGLAPNIKKLVGELPEVDLLVYAAGFAQLGKITDLEDADIGRMACVGLVAPALIMREVLEKQGSLQTFVAITSTSAWKPRLEEPLYAATKAGLGMLANSLALDERIKHTLVVGPGGMKTPFWDDTQTDASGYLEVSSVADEIMKSLPGDYRYRCIKIPRETGHAEVIEER